MGKKENTRFFCSSHYGTFRRGKMADISGPRSPEHDPGVVGPQTNGQGARFDTTFTPGKIFVGGLVSETSEADLKHYFNVYGEVVDVVVMRDKITGNGRGFGFVTFADMEVAKKVAAQKHEVRGRTVEAKIAVPRGEQIGGGGGGKSGGVCKIFVGGLAPDLNDTEFRGYFDTYGSIVDAKVMVDPKTQRSRGFGFVTFDRPEPVDEIMHRSDHIIKGKEVEVKRAVPRSVELPGGGGAPGGGGRGGPMMGRDSSRDGGGGGGWGGGPDRVCVCVCA
jgi:RNA recognition motif-containing protein